MRTTLTLEPDVASLLEEIRKRRGTTFKQVVNDALRMGLRQMEQGAAGKRSYRTRAVSLGRPRLPDVDDVAEVLALTEGETFR